MTNYFFAWVDDYLIIMVAFCVTQLFYTCVKSTLHISLYNIFPTQSFVIKVTIVVTSMQTCDCDCYFSKFKL